MLSSSFTWFWLCFWGLGLPSWAPSIVTTAQPLWQANARWVVKGLRIWPRESNDRVLKGSGYCTAAQNNGSALLPTRHHENHGFKYKIAENTKWLAVVVQWISSLEANRSPVSIEVRFSFVCPGQSTLLGKLKVLLPWSLGLQKLNFHENSFQLFCVSINGITSYTPTYYILYLDKCVKV